MAKPYAQLYNIVVLFLFALLLKYAFYVPQTVMFSYAMD